MLKFAVYPQLCISSRYAVAAWFVGEIMWDEGGDRSLVQNARAQNLKKNELLRNSLTHRVRGHNRTHTHTHTPASTMVHFIV